MMLKLTLCDDHVLLHTSYNVVIDKHSATSNFIFLENNMQFGDEIIC